VQQNIAALRPIRGEILGCRAAAINISLLWSEELLPHKAFEFIGAAPEFDRPRGLRVQVKRLQILKEPA